MKKYFDIMFKIEPYRDQDLSTPVTNADDKKKARKTKKMSDKRKDEIDLEDEKEREKKEEEERLRKEKQEEASQILRLGHEKLVISCLGIGYTNITKPIV
jgi:hypothetical protein